MKYQIGHFVIVNDAHRNKQYIGKITGIIKDLVYEYYIQTKHDERSYAGNKYRLNPNELQDYIVCSVPDIHSQTEEQHRALLREIDCINCILEG